MNRILILVDFKTTDWTRSVITELLFFCIQVYAPVFCLRQASCSRTANFRGVEDLFFLFRRDVVPLFGCN